MKKPNSRKSATSPLDDDLRPEYGPGFFKTLKPNRFASRFREGEVIAVTLDPDVAEVFDSSESVNTLLRSVIKAFPKRRARKKPSKRRAV